MITVAIYINGEAIYCRSARNTSVDKDGATPAICTYRLDTGKTIKHLRADGAVALAQKMLEDIKEP